MNRCTWLNVSALLMFVICGQAFSQAAFPWQNPNAIVRPTGDLQWQPQPFELKLGNEVRYIDYQNGDDQNDGKTQQTAWKHHPWDTNAKANAKADQQADTYIFKRGVIYRGKMLVQRQGKPDSPIRLTSDPAWGGADAEAVISGAQRVTDFTKLTDRPATDNVSSKPLSAKLGDWGSISYPMMAKPGQPMQINLTIDKTFAGEKVVLGLNWGKKNGQFAGYNASSNPRSVQANPGHYTLKITPRDKPDLGAFSLTVYRSTSGNWGDRTFVQTVPIELFSDAKANRPATADLIPDPEHVWYTDLSFAPRNIWMVDKDNHITRIPLARTPNWQVENDDDIKSQWWQFDNPGNPHFKKINIGSNDYFLGIDTKHLTAEPELYDGAYVWTEYGWVMGTPYPSRIIKYYPEKNGIAIRGQWGGGAGGYTLPRYSRYYLEDKPQFLDDPDGEFWFEKTGSGGRLYLRLPSHLNPNQVDVEVAEHATLIDAEHADHLSITGLTFRFTNTWWDLAAIPPTSKDVDPACIRVLGQADNITIANNLFEHINTAVRMIPKGDAAAIANIKILDNVIQHTDHGGIRMTDGWNWGESHSSTRLLDVTILRNKLQDIGKRPTLYGQGHAIDIACPQTCQVAGNVLDRLYGSGIFVYGGKQSMSKEDRPLSRILIHHNKVTNSLLNNNDWGGIETWQGGPAYVFDNISGNPGGFKLWGIKNQPNVPASARFGHAYYMDGGFKQYYFNNIAWGKSSDPYSPLGNTAAFQEIHGYLASVFNNTAYNFVIGSRRQGPEAGKNKYMGNIFSNIGHMVFRHARPSKQQADPNQHDVGKIGEDYDHVTNAYVDNLFYKIPDNLGSFTAKGDWYGSLKDMAQAMHAHGTIGNVGTVSQQPVLSQPEKHDFTPTAQARDHGVRMFVPWGLYATSAEWHFYHKGNEPTQIPDEHFHLQPNYVNRTDYHNQPRFDLTLINGTESDYQSGPLEDWTNGTVVFDGNKRYATLTQSKLDAMINPVIEKAINKPSDWVTVDAPDTLVPGKKATIQFKITKSVTGMQLRADLNWLDTSNRFKGMNVYGGKGIPVTDKGTYAISFTPVDKPQLGNFLLTVWLTPTGGWNDRTDLYQFTINKGRPDDAYVARSPQIHQSNFIIEAYFRAENQGQKAILIQKHDGQTGYSLTLNPQGHVDFAMAANTQQAQVTSRNPMADGNWHHVLVECDRAQRILQLFIDGKRDQSSAGLGSVSLANQADLFVGGSPNGMGLKGDMEFLRIAHGTLADAKTTIEELYAWQFDGPFLRDFAGNKPIGKRDAGAIEFKAIQ